MDALEVASTLKRSRVYDPKSRFLKVYSCPAVNVLKGARDVQLKLSILPLSAPTIDRPGA
jgi:hypothetical protein